jgi:hypothetical protein
MSVRISSRGIVVDYIEELFNYKQKKDKEQWVITMNASTGDRSEKNLISPHLWVLVRVPEVEQQFYN